MQGICRRVVLLLVLPVMVLSVAGRVQAEFVYTGEGGNNLWSTPGNWNAGVPDTSTWTKVDVVPGPVVAADATVGNLHIGRHGEPGEVTVDGGTLVVDNWLTLSRGSDATLTLMYLYSVS